MFEITRLRDEIEIPNEDSRCTFNTNTNSDTSSYPDSSFREVRTASYLLPGRHVRIPVPHECHLQILKLMLRKVRPLPPLSFILLTVLVVGIVNPDHPSGRDDATAGTQLVFHFW